MASTFTLRVIPSPKVHDEHRQAAFALADKVEAALHACDDLVVERDVDVLNRPSVTTAPPHSPGARHDELSEADAAIGERLVADDADEYARTLPLRNVGLDRSLHVGMIRRSNCSPTIGKAAGSAEKCFLRRVRNTGSSAGACAAI